MFAMPCALLVAALFGGAALYVSVAEQPARLQLDDRALLIEWKPAYHRGALMQASLAVLGFLLGMLAWWSSKHPAWLIGALAMIANWPFTLVVIKPVNDRLNAIDPNDAGSECRALIERWGKLHAVRTALGLVATLSFLWGSLAA